jgi:hypothetical protein
MNISINVRQRHLVQKYVQKKVTAPLSFFFTALTALKSLFLQDHKVTI